MPNSEKEYSLWKTTQRIEPLIKQISPIRKQMMDWPGAITTAQAFKTNESQCSNI